MGTIFVPVLIVSALGLIFGIVLAFSFIFFAVPTDEKVEALVEALPGANCGACGYPACEGYAKAIAHEDAPTNKCPVGGAAVAAKVSEIMGISFAGTVREYAKVMCQGKCGIAPDKMNYQGVQTCAACSQLYGGKSACSYGCLGLADCVKACPYGAIKIVDGIAEIDPDLCTGCKICTKICPKGIISMVPETAAVHALCSSHDKGIVTKKACSLGCIGCKKCEKTCEYGAITVENNCAKVDYTKCTNCGACVAQCPTGTIVNLLAYPDCFDNKEQAEQWETTEGLAEEKTTE